MQVSSLQTIEDLQRELVSEWGCWCQTRCHSDNVPVTTGVAGHSFFSHGKGVWPLKVGRKGRDRA